MSVSLPLAHGIGEVQDLPIPRWLFYYAASLTLILSFVALGVLWRKPRLDGEQGRPLGDGLQRFLLWAGWRVLLGAISFGLLVLVWLAALVGAPDAGDNLAPVFVWVVFWLGLVPVVVLFGNLWSVLSPWRAAADAVAWGWSKTGRRWESAGEYPGRLGRWPAAGLFLAFATLELAWPRSAEPRTLALAIVVYSWITWAGMLLFGRRVWTENGEAFHVYFGLLSRISPFAVRGEDGGRRVVVRAPLSGLARDDSRPGTVAFVAVMLGAVAYDGFSGIDWWETRRYELEARYIVDSPTKADFAYMGFSLLGLLVAVLAVAILFSLAVWAARAVGRTDRSLAGAFVGSLIPIALAYAVAHYFTLLVERGQSAIALVSDPFGRGWDLLGTADFQPQLNVFSPNTIWYVQVAVLVVGHVLGLVLAHDRAVALFSSAGTALRTQYAMLALMVLYTCTGLWLLSSG
ncbi:MAG: fenitrothion hydrolase [Actinomycetota bacterium]|nr:fenitrothion hydrolase [Actinomycetota bacterium]